MGDNWAFDTLNAKRLSANEIAGSFVVPAIFGDIAGLDHCYIVGPRGSGKTTLLRMLQGESLMAWNGREAEHYRRVVSYSSIFLPADELWASQSDGESARAAFTAQMLYSFLSEVQYRTGYLSSENKEIHFPVTWTKEDEVLFSRECSEAWQLHPRTYTILGLQTALDLFLLQVGAGNADPGVFGNHGSIELLRFGIDEFNRRTRQPSHRWALLLDEMELAPQEIHEEVQRFVRGGAGRLILKVSMSPFDRYVTTYGSSGPIAGNDYRAVFLSGLSRADIRRFTEGLWREALKHSGFRPTSMTVAFGSTTSEGNFRSKQEFDRVVQETLRAAQLYDPEFSLWLKSRHVDINRLSDLTYYQRSATIRKVYPLVVFRNALLSFRNGKPVRRSRKKSIEPFTGVEAVTTILEGNPRWIKSAFSEMMRTYDPHSKSVSPGFQYDALVAVANRFDALLHVLPRTSDLRATVNVPALVDTIAAHLNRQNLGTFSPDPQNCFTVDGGVEQDVIDALILALYAGAVVHVRDRRSPATISDFRGQRFRLTYLLAIRDGKEFPLRLGKDVKLSRVIAGFDLSQASGRRLVQEIARDQMEFEFE